MSVSSSSLSKHENGRSTSFSPYGVVATAQFQSGPPVSKIRHSSEDGEVFETVKEEAWEERKKKTTTTTRNIEKRVQRKLVLEDGAVVGDTGPVITEDQTENTVTKEIVSDEKQKPVGQQLALEPPPGDGWVATPGAVIISEKSTKITNSHDEVEDEIETEEIQHCGDVTNKEVNDHIKGKSDLRELIAHRQSKGWELAKPQKRVVYEATRKRGNIDTEDVKEHSRIEDGHVVTDTERTVRQEQYDNESAPDSGSSLSDGSVHEVTKETSHNLVHTKDEDLLEYYAVPVGGTLAQGVKLGEGMHVVNEDIHEDKQGDEEPPSDKIRKIRKPSRRDALTKKPLDYSQEEQTRKKETNRWLENHFGSESGRSESSSQEVEDSEPNHKAGGNRITITMSPHPATHEDRVDSTPTRPMRRWIDSPPQASSTPKAPPPPPPKPTRIWSSSSPIYSPSSPVPPPVQSPPSSSSGYIQDTEIAEARARLRYTGRKLIEENKENNAPEESSMINAPSSHRFQNSLKSGKSSSSFKLSSLKDAAIYNSKFRSGKPKRDAPSTPEIISPPEPVPPSNVGRSQSFHVQTLPISTSKKKEPFFSRFKTSYKEYKSEERLDNINDKTNSKTLVYDSNTVDGRGRSKNNSSIDTRTSKEQQSSWRKKLSSWSPTRKNPSPPPSSRQKKGSPTRVSIFSSDYTNGIETGTQTGVSPVAPPRRKKKVRPQSSYFFGQETAACIFPNGNRERTFSDNSYRNSTTSHRFTEDNTYHSNTSPKVIKTYKTTKIYTPVLSYNNDRNEKMHTGREDYYSNSNKSSWTNTVDPRRKPRVSNEEVRSKTLPKKPRSTLSFPSSRKTYMFGESDSANESGHENNNHHNYRGSMQNISTINSDYNQRYNSMTNRLTNHTSKPVGRSHSFNVQPGRSNPPSVFNGRTLADISGQRTSSNYGSSPYLNLRSPSLISTIHRTSSIQKLNSLEDEVIDRRIVNGLDSLNRGEDEKKSRFMKGLQTQAPELFQFIHGNENEDKTDGHLKRNTPPSTLIKPSTYAASPSAKSPSYSARVFTFGKSDNNTLTRTSSQGNDSGFSNSYNSMEENSKKNSTLEKQKRHSSYESSTLENNKKNALINSANRRSTFNLKTSGSSLLYSPSFRSENEDRRLSRTSSGEKDTNRLSGDFTGKGHLSTNVREGSPVLIQVRDWNAR